MKFKTLITSNKGKEKNAVGKEHTGALKEMVTF